MPESQLSGNPQVGVIIFPQADSPGRNLPFSRKMAAVISRDDPPSTEIQQPHPQISPMPPNPDSLQVSPVCTILPSPELKVTGCELKICALAS